jgi:archaellum component FlaD/FlaE
MKAQEQLLQQGTDIVSALSNQVPVLGNCPPEYTSRMATNFLRSGCPGVQIVFDPIDVDETIGWSWKEELRRLKKFFKALRLKDENFKFSCSEDPPFVLLVTRSAPRTRQSPDK